MDWSSIERAVNAKTQSFARPSFAPPSSSTSAVALSERSLSARSFPSKVSYEYGGSGSSFGKENLLFLTNSATPHPASAGGGIQAEPPLPSPPSATAAAPAPVHSTAASTAPPSSSSSAWSRGLDALLGNELSELRRLVHTQNSRLEALEGQNERLRVDYIQTKHSLDDLSEKYSLLDSTHRKSLQHLDSLASQAEALQSLQRKHDHRLSQVEDQQATHHPVFIRKDQLQPMLDGLLEQVHASHTATAGLAHRTAETASRVDCLLHAWLDTSPSSPPSDPASSWQVALLPSSSSSSETHAAHLQARLAAGLQQRIERGVQPLVTAGEERLQASLLVCLHEMRQHCDVLLRPALEGQAALRQAQAALQLRLDRPAATAAASPLATTAATDEAVRALQTHCQRLEDGLQAVRHDVDTRLAAQLAACATQAETHTHGVRQAVDVLTARVDHHAELWRSLQASTQTCTASLEAVHADVRRLHTDLDTHAALAAHPRGAEQAAQQLARLAADWTASQASAEASTRQTISRLERDLHTHTADTARHVAACLAAVHDAQATARQDVQAVADTLRTAWTADLSPVQTNYDALRGALQQCVADHAALARDVVSRLDALGRDGQERRAWWDEREQRLTQRLLDKLAALETHCQAGLHALERKCQDTHGGGTHTAVHVAARLDAVDDKLHTWTGWLADWQDAARQMAARLDRTDAVLRTELDRIRDDVHRVAADCVDQCAAAHRLQAGQWEDCTDALRQASGKLKTEIDGLRSDCHEKYLERTDFQAALNKWALQLAALDKASEEANRHWQLALREESRIRDAHLLEVKEEVRVQGAACEAACAAARQASEARWAQAEAQAADLDRRWADRLDAQVCAWRQSLAEQLQAERTAAAAALNAALAQQTDPLHATVQTLVRQNYECSGLLDQLADGLQAQRGEALAAREALWREALAGREAAAARLQAAYQTLAAGLEELRYDVAAVQHRCQRLEDTSEEVRDGPGPAPDAVPAAAALQRRLDLLEHTVRTLHQTLACRTSEGVPDGVPPSSFATAATTEEVLGEIEKAAAARAQAVQEAVEAVQRRVRGLEGAWEALRASDRPDRPDVEARLQSLAEAACQALWAAQHAPALDKVHRGLATQQALLDALQDEVVDLGTRLERGPGPDDGLAGTVEGLSGTVEGLSGQMEGLSGRVEGLSGRMEGLSGEVEGLSGQMEGLSGRVEGLSGRMEGLSGRVEGLSGEVEGRSGRVEGLSGEVEGRREQAAASPRGGAPAAEVPSSQPLPVSGTAIQRDDSPPAPAPLTVETPAPPRPSVGEAGGPRDVSPAREAPASPPRSLEGTSPGHTLSMTSPQFTNSFDDEEDEEEEEEEEDDEEEDEEVEEGEDEDEEVEASAGEASLGSLGGRRDGFGAAHGVDARGFSADAGLDPFAGLSGRASAPPALSSRRVDSLLRDVDALPGGEDSVDSHDLEADFQRMRPSPGRAGRGGGPTSRNQRDDRRARAGLSEDEEEDDFVSSDSDSDGPEQDDDDEEEEEEGEEEEDRLRDQDEAPTPALLRPAPAGPLAPLPLPLPLSSTRSTGAALSPLRPGVPSISGPTLAHIPPGFARGSGGLSSAPVLSGSLLTRSRLGLPAPSGPSAPSK